VMISFGCCEVWETRSVFQGAVGKSKTCPQPRRLSAAGGSKREFRQLSVSKSLTRSAPPRGGDSSRLTDRLAGIFE